MDLNDEDEEDSQNASESDDGNIKVNFDEKPQGKQSKLKPQDKGIMGLKFMQRAEQTRKEVAKEQAKMLIDQIKEDAEDSQEEEAKKNFVKGADRFGGKAL